MIKMKFYSEDLDKLFSTQKELEKAEQEAKVKAYKEKQEKEKKDAERKARAKEVEEARKNMVAARSKYAELLEAFTRDYGAFHMSLDGEDAKRAIPTLFNLFDDLFI